MELTTHCPQCATAFLVSEDQLELAQGWVRCGVCQEIFMAQAHTAAPVIPAAPTMRNVMPQEPVLQRQETVSPDEPLDDTSSRAPVNPAADRAHAAPVTANTRYRQASIAAVIFLLTLLAVQTGIDAYRGIAGAQPALARWLQSGCAPSRCVLRHSSAFSIDDSSLTSAGANAFHLRAVISNRSELTLEAPSLALTLTDAADEVLARKVYAPIDWAAQADALQGASTTPIDLWVQWDDPSTTARVAGYRLQAFYP